MLKGIAAHSPPPLSISNHSGKRSRYRLPIRALRLLGVGPRLRRALPLLLAAAPRPALALQRSASYFSAAPIRNINIVGLAYF